MLYVVGVFTSKMNPKFFLLRQRSLSAINVVSLWKPTAMDKPHVPCECYKADGALLVTLSLIQVTVNALSYGNTFVYNI